MFIFCIQKGVTPLHWAIDWKNQAMAEWLVTLGADIHWGDNVSMVNFTYIIEWNGDR